MSTTTTAQDALRSRTAERHAALRAAHAEAKAALSAKVDALFAAVSAEGRTVTDAERAEFQAITAEQNRLDAILQADLNDAKPSVTEWKAARCADRGIDPDTVCGRCGGTGQYHSFGTCYGCGGTGRIEEEG